MSVLGSGCHSLLSPQELAQSLVQTSVWEYWSLEEMGRVIIGRGLGDSRRLPLHKYAPPAARANVRNKGSDSQKHRPPAVIPTFIHLLSSSTLSTYYMPGPIGGAVPLASHSCQIPSGYFNSWDLSGFEHLLDPGCFPIPYLSSLPLDQAGLSVITRENSREPWVVLPSYSQAQT